MAPSLAFLINRSRANETLARSDKLRIALVATLHLAALAIMLWTEIAIVPKVVFLLTWGILNFFWLTLLRRPLVAAVLSLAMIVGLIMLSRLKYEMIWMTVNFLDFMIIDLDLVGYVFNFMPDLWRKLLLVALAVVPAFALIWWLDRFRVRRRTALAGLVVSLATVTGIAIVEPQEGWEAFFGDSYVSKFTRSGVTALTEWTMHGYLDAGAVAATADRLPVRETSCTPAPAQRLPNIILIHDESSFDIRVVPGVKVPPDYGTHFRSFDGKARRFIVEGVGGPSWFTEFNALAGLSARSFGRFAYYVSQIAAGHIERGLPVSLLRCGYRTYSIFPAMGAFMSARTFQRSIGIQEFYDQTTLGTDRIEPDQFYYDAAIKTIARERENGPLFLYVYLAQNHYPWDYRWRPDLLPEWRDLGNVPIIDEYLRRQTLSAHDYAALLEKLRREFPGQPFLIVRYGDHQPDFTTYYIDPQIDETGIAQRLAASDPRYFTTYYAINTINFTPANLTSALDTIEGPYLPLIVQEAAGVPLDASFIEQKKVEQRCNGLFYGCAGGAEARRFNRLLIDAGLIKRL